MKNITSAGIALAMLSAAVPLAFALDVNGTVQPSDGMLQQPEPSFMNAAPIIPPVNSTMTQEIRAANLLVHQEDTLVVGSPAYSDAHRLLIQNLRMMQRQSSFNSTDLAQFNSETHAARSTVDPKVYSPDDGSAPALNQINQDVSGADETTVFSPNVDLLSDDFLSSHTYVGNAPSRRTIIAAAEEQNRLHAEALLQ